MIGIIQIDIGRIFEGIFGFFQGQRSVQSAAREFLNACITKNSRLGQDWVSDASFILDTERAYVPMRLVGADGRPESFATVFGKNRRLVIQGQVGAGKSTLTRYMTLIMARALLDPATHGGLPRYHLNSQPLFPLRVELKRCNDGTSIYDATCNAIPFLMPDYVDQRLKQGGILLLFDGLDEVGQAARRHRVMEEILDLADRLQQSSSPNSFVVTTRSASYHHRVLAGGGFALFTLQELAPRQQEDMVRRYYALWSEKNTGWDGSGNWHAKASELVDQLHSNPGLVRLKSNPLFLSWMAMLHYRGETLPARRHALYEKCVEHLVTRREDISPVPQEEIHRRLTILGELAIAMHMQKEHDTFSRLEVEETLDKALRRRMRKGVPESLVSTLIDKMEKEWGLLVNHGGEGVAQARYSFPNLSLQEYLAAYVVYHDADHHWATLKAHLSDPWWEEVVRLYTAMGGKAGRDSTLDRVLAELIHVDKSISNATWIQAGRYLANEDSVGVSSPFHSLIVDRLQSLSREVTEEGVKAFEDLCQIEPDGQRFAIKRILQPDGALDEEDITRLLRRMEDPDARQALRDALLSALDQRPRIEDRITLAEVLAQIGDMRLGQLVDVECAPRRGAVVCFRIGKFPVTNEEYARIVQASGRPAPPHWGGDVYPMRLANHPVTYISLDDATNYCQWQSRETGQAFRLPTEAEWCVAADPDSSGRRFPWGNIMDQFYANLRGRVNIGRTTPVGIYREGQNELGLADLFGNVWEWTSTAERGRDKQDLSVLKGCAWDTLDAEASAGLQARRLEPATMQSASIGFRVLVENPQVPG